MTFCWQKYTLILDFEHLNECTRKKVCHIHFLLPVGKISAHLAGFYCPKQWFLCLLLAPYFVAHVVGNKNHCLDRKSKPNGLIFRPKVDENEYDIHFFLLNLFCCFKPEEFFFVSQMSLRGKLIKETPLYDIDMPSTSYTIVSTVLTLYFDLTWWYLTLALEIFVSLL